MKKGQDDMIIRKLLWFLPLLSLLLCSCNGQIEEDPAWLFVDNVQRHALNRFECCVQEGILTEVEYVFRHPQNPNAAAGMVATWKLGDEAPVCTDIAQMQGNNTWYDVHHLPACLHLLEQHPEQLPKNCHISIWMPQEKELQDLLSQNDYLIGRVGDGLFRAPEAGEVPLYSWQINKEPYREYSVLFGVLLVEGENGEVVSLVLLEGTLS